MQNRVQIITSLFETIIYRGMERAMNKDGRRARIETVERERQREELDEVLTVFRLTRGHAEPAGWLRAMRHAIGVPAAEVGRRVREERDQAGGVGTGGADRAAEPAADGGGDGLRSWCMR